MVSSGMLLIVEMAPCSVHRGSLLTLLSITVTPRYNTVIGMHLLGPPYKRGALWDLVDLIDIVIPRLPAPRYP